jgi:pyruvate kinase
VRKPEEVQNVKEKLGMEGAHIRIFSKIENHEGVENFESILAESDGIIINRKTLGIELPSEKVFIAQKWMTWRANLASKTVIVSSQILESMVKNIRPKEAEVQDIANIVADGGDVIQLSQETSNGINIEKSIV